MIKHLTHANSRDSFCFIAIYALTCKQKHSVPSTANDS